MLMAGVYRIRLCSATKMQILVVCIDPFTYQGGRHFRRSDGIVFCLERAVTTDFGRYATPDWNASTIRRTGLVFVR
jgi:hypothetical protein